ncbi:MAG TPA: YggT family protein [Chloroflexi bacterium]|jgi:YggT family protein|nr:YggT family protein [Chloroflexota bacterium]
MRLLFTFVNILAQVLNLAILARVLLSWIPLDRDNAVVRIVYEVTEPILGPIRRVLPPLGGLDLSPIVALVLIQVLQRVLLTIIVGLA